MLEGLKEITEHLRAVQPAMKALGDGLRHPTDEELLGKAYALGQELSELHLTLKSKVPSQFDSAIEENIDLLHGILNNLAGIRMHYYIAKNAPACECGECDSCVAGRSDDHFDRQRDGLLCDED